MRDWSELENKLREELLILGSVSHNGKFATYRSIQYEGCLGDFAREYWTEKDYKEHEEYIKTLGEDFGKPYISTLTLIHNEKKDVSTIKAGNMESYSFDIIDFSK